MRRTVLLGAVAAFLALGFVHSAAAQDKGYWRAASSTAKSITGDIALTDTKLTINFAGFTLAQIRALTPAEGSAVFDVQNGVGGNLYRLNIPAARRFQHKNTLCGSEDTQWMATYGQGSTLYVDFFSGPEMPKLTFDAISNSTDLCGTFTYVR